MKIHSTVASAFTAVATVATSNPDDYLMQPRQRPQCVQCCTGQTDRLNETPMPTEK